jgi:hypothetical protein
MPRTLLSLLVGTSSLLSCFFLTACGSKTSPAAPPPAPVASAPAAAPGVAANPATASQNAARQQFLNDQQAKAASGGGQPGPP